MLSGSRAWIGYLDETNIMGPNAVEQLPDPQKGWHVTYVADRESEPVHGPTFASFGEVLAWAEAHTPDNIVFQDERGRSFDPADRPDLT
ncbi:hypothetical protein SAMN04515671_3144 [Nakamurella panacisegetis]|uniref:Uncharacterized protein n=1 Tax=Nakamurella panacisegetis TaxID=1090615 RepID=A0A1H0QLM2_9ACTN|nr:hypothetical protein [Nakamurella panacisegetis]SDP18100.1 hypothetical protein SAMN04515671_3144 [Nakamurella panacisegetis]